MDRVRAGDFRGGNDVRDIEVAFGRRAGADTDGFVRHLDVQAVAVGFGMDGDGFKPHLAAGADDAHGDFAAVGDQDFLKHSRSLRVGFDFEKRLAVFDRMAVGDQRLDDFARRGRDHIFHDLHRFDRGDRLSGGRRQFLPPRAADGRGESERKKVPTMVDLIVRVPAGFGASAAAAFVGAGAADWHLGAFLRMDGPPEADQGALFLPDDFLEIR